MIKKESTELLLREAGAVFWGFLFSKKLYFIELSKISV